MGDRDPLLGAPLVRRRPRFRCSLRAILCIVALICVWLGIVSAHARRQRRAVETLIRHGDVQCAIYDFEYLDDGESPSPPPGSGWLRKLVGLDYFATVVQVEADYLGDDGSALGDLPNLKTLKICADRLSDRDIGYLRLSPGMHHLVLCVAAPSISDSGWRALESLQNLEDLTVGGGGITDSTLRHVAELGNLKSLTICSAVDSRVALVNSRVTEAGLRDMMSRLTNLTSLELSGVPEFSDDDLRDLAVHLTRIEHLDLGGTRVTDGGLGCLAQLTALSWLDLEYTSVSDAGLQHLSGLPRLANLLVTGTRVTTEGFDKLKLAMPKLK